MTLSQNKIEKILQAIKETKDILKKELGYAVHLQKQNNVKELQDHLNKLNMMLEENAKITYLAI